MYTLSFSRSASATGPACLSTGNTGPEQLGHLYPAGAVVAGSSLNFWFSAFQSKTSGEYGQGKL